MPDTADEVRDVIGKIEPDHPLRKIFDVWLTEGEDVANVLKDRLAGWFDEGMTRVSGWYSRRVKVIIFVIAAAVTIATNASSIHENGGDKLVHGSGGISQPRAE